MFSMSGRLPYADSGGGSAALAANGAKTSAARHNSRRTALNEMRHATSPQSRPESMRMSAIGKRLSLCGRGFR
jgi:hypothetical protein